MQLLVFGTCATTTVIMVVSSQSQLVIHPSYPLLRAPLLFYVYYGPVLNVLLLLQNELLLLQAQ